MFTALVIAAMWSAPADARPLELPPLPIAAEDAAAVVCPDRHAAALLYRIVTSELRPDEDRALRAAYDAEVARWAVCARVMDLQSFGVPGLQEPLAEQLRAAALTEPGQRARVEAIERSAGAFPSAAGLLALEELSVVSLIGRAEPQRRLELTAAAVGVWGCGNAIAWERDDRGDEVGYCTDGRSIETMATAGLQRLATLAREADRDDGDWLRMATADRVDTWWASVSEVAFPLPENAPLRVPEDGVGPPLEPGLGWSGRISDELVAWQRRPSFFVERVGIVVRQPGIWTRRPDDWDAAPVLYIDGDVRLARIDEVLREAEVARPIFVAQRAGSMNREELVELRLLWRPDAPPPDGARVVRLGRLGGSLARMQAQVEHGAGPVWILADQGVRYRDLVAAHGAVAARASGPVVVSLRSDAPAD